MAVAVEADPHVERTDTMRWAALPALWIVMTAGGCSGATRIEADGGPEADADAHVDADADGDSDGDGDVDADGGGDGDAESDGDVESDADDDGDLERAFRVTISNGGGEPLFLDGLFLPFFVARDGSSLSLSSLCSCSVCGTGETCMHGDPRPMAIALPVGETIIVDVDLVRYTSRSVSGSDCPEADFYSACDEGRPFDPGLHELVVRYDEQEAIEAQGLELTESERWGHAVWAGHGIGTVMLDQETRQEFSIEAEGLVAVELGLP